MKLKIYILVLVSLFAISCKKKTYVTIQAKHLVTGEGSGYANMPFSVVESWTPFFEKETKKVYSGTLNENGYASFELKMNKNRKYELSVNTPDDICYGKLHFYSLNHSKNNNIEFDYLTCGNVDIHHENINCEGETDEFRYTYYFTQSSDIYIYRGAGITGPANNWSWKDYHPASGCYPYYKDKSVAVPEGNYTVEWQVTKPSGITTGIDTFTVYENDTTTYLIQY